MQILYNIISSVLIFAIKLLVYIFKKFKTSNLLLCLVESKIGKNIADEQKTASLGFGPKRLIHFKEKKKHHQSTPRNGKPIWQRSVIYYIYLLLKVS